MAKITTITNPLTGQPAQVDQLDHTAQEIDDAIARALPGGAIDTALQKKADEVEAQELKLFGYISPELPNGVKNYIEGNVFHKRVGRVDLGTLNWIYQSDFNYFYALYTDIVTNPGDGFVYAICSRYSWGNVRDASADKVFSNVSFNYINQISVKDTDYTTVEAFKAAVAGVYVYYQKATEETYSILDCDWSMPPMELGVEYRTTERYMGKPVYVKMIDFGPMPNATQKGVAHGISNMDAIVGNAIFVTKNGLTWSTEYTYEDISHAWCDRTSSYMRTKGDMTSFSATVTIKYTKTTD